MPLHFFSVPRGWFRRFDTLLSLFLCPCRRDHAFHSVVFEHSSKAKRMSSHIANVTFHCHSRLLYIRYDFGTWDRIKYKSEQNRTTSFRTSGIGRKNLYHYAKFSQIVSVKSDLIIDSFMRFYEASSWSLEVTDKAPSSSILQLFPSNSSISRWYLPKWSEAESFHIQSLYRVGNAVHDRKILVGIENLVDEKLAFKNRENGIFVFHARSALIVDCETTKFTDFRIFLYSISFSNVARTLKHEKTTEILNFLAFSVWFVNQYFSFEKKNPWRWWTLCNTRHRDKNIDIVVRTFYISQTCRYSRERICRKKWRVKSVWETGFVLEIRVDFISVRKTNKR